MMHESMLMEMIDYSKKHKVFDIDAIKEIAESRHPDWLAVYEDEEDKSLLEASLKHQEMEWNKKKRKREKITDPKAIARYEQFKRMDHAKMQEYIGQCEKTFGSPMTKYSGARGFSKAYYTCPKRDEDDSFGIQLDYTRGCRCCEYCGGILQTESKKQSLIKCFYPQKVR